MRIVHVITRLVHGGAQINTLMTARHQHERGHLVWLAAGPETGPEGSLWTQAASLSPVLVPHLVREVDPLRDLLAFFEIARLLWRTRPDVIHTHTSKAGLLGRWAAWLLRVPVVIHTPHGHVFHSYFSSRKTRLFVALERLTARITKKMVMLTEAERDEHLAVGVGTPDQMVVIPSGVNLDVLPVERPTRADLGLPEGVPLVGYVGRLAEIKGPVDLIQAMAHVVDAIPDAHLAMLGDGPLRSDIEAQAARLKLAAHLTMMGPRPTAGPLLSLVDLLVIPSRNEGMGRVAVEAMAAGIPVVATRVGGLSEVVGDAGLLVQCGDLVAMGNAIIALLRDRTQARRLADAGRQRATRYSLDGMLSALDSLYSDLL